MRYRCIKGFTFDTEEGDIGEVIKNTVWEEKQDKIESVLMINVSDGWDSLQGSAIWIEIPKDELKEFFKPLLN